MARFKKKKKRRIGSGKKAGSIRQERAILAEDEAKRPCIYFFSAQGPYRLGAQGLECCGHDIEDIWATIKRMRL